MFRGIAKLVHRCAKRAQTVGGVASGERSLAGFEDAPEPLLAAHGFCSKAAVMASRGLADCPFWGRDWADDEFPLFTPCAIVSKVGRQTVATNPQCVSD